MGRSRSEKQVTKVPRRARQERSSRWSNLGWLDERTGCKAVGLWKVKSSLEALRNSWKKESVRERGPPYLGGTMIKRLLMTRKTPGLLKNLRTSRHHF